MTPQKISFKVPPELWQSFSVQARDLFLSRAPFLNHMIATEVPHLKNDLAGKSLSLRAKRHISGMLKKQGAKSVNIEVEQNTAEQLNDVVRECNLVRDAFLCRMIVFLRGSDALLKYLEIPQQIDVLSSQVPGLESMPTSPLKAMESVRDDPLFYIRHHLDEFSGCGIYNVALPRKLDWMACYLEDEDVPGTPKHNKEQREQREMAEAFALIEAKAFAASPSQRKGGAA